MGQERLGKAVNGFLLKEEKRNGQIEGDQSLNNRRMCVFFYDSELEDFVGKWIDTPAYVRKSLNAH